MHLILKYLKVEKRRIVINIILKALAVWSELMVPYVLSHIIDDLVPTGKISPILIWGIVMIILAVMTRQLNVLSNRRASAVGRDCRQRVRQELFEKTIRLSGREFEEVSLPSLISRMTSDSYNVQDFLVSIQTMGTRAPGMLIVGIGITLVMDPALALILCVMVPILGVIIFAVMRYGIPLYDKVQRSIDKVVSVLRENITGIRVVKALCREDYERDRFHKANWQLAKDDIKANFTMALPSPLMQLILNIGLSLVVLAGAYRVNSGATKPGVILAFLTYFNMILQGVMSLNRLFMMASKATASAKRIEKVLDLPDEDDIVDDNNIHNSISNNDMHIEFSNVNFSYNKTEKMCLSDINFTIKKGESLGIIGATGSGKTSIINLMMRFYRCNSGEIYIDGKNVSSYDKTELRRKFGVVFQNDIILNDTLFENISFGRDLSEEQVKRAARTAGIADYIENLDNGYQHMADIKGANLSGGQKQRILVARALAAEPEILILDDSSSALDYKTDANLRRAINKEYSNSTLIMIAQRVSSVMKLTDILVLENGQMIGYGKHENLLLSCPVYKDIYDSQMGEL